ncbi:MAG: CotH kinase family protein [Oscillospiraceae bacterium]|nr:CotH kinase family protein [Oscillospiraceae bacterium]
MILGIKWQKRLAFILAAVLFAIVAVYYLCEEKSNCMGVSIVSEDKLEYLADYKDIDLDGQIMHMDMPVAMDNATRTIYISQNLDGKSFYTDMEGVLTTSQGYPMYFIREDAFDSFAQSVAEGHSFSLLVELSENTYTQYSVVFTNLPVVRVTGEKAYVNYDKRSVYDGDITVWIPEYEKAGKYSVQHSSVEWHRRGGSTFMDDKKSWKLALKNEDGTNNNLDFLGLEEGDDDWILNAIHRDDTKIREKFVMDIWNRYCETASYNYKMSTGRYVEVVNNGQYWGLYLLQRRVDGKYLELDDEILLKSIKRAEQLPIEFFYDIVYPKVEATERDDPNTDNLSEDEKRIYGLIEPFHREEYGNLLDIDNWMDVSLMIDFGYMADNSGQKNIFYLMENISDDMKIKMVLWDTDFSFGIDTGKTFVHKPEGVTENRRYRTEEDYLRTVYPQLDKMLAERWFEMRGSIFDKENIYSVISDNYENITRCGAFDREKALWGNYYEGGTDTIDTIYEHIDLRLEFLDKYHREILQ